MEKAPDFELESDQGKKIRLSDLWEKGTLMLVFYPGDFTPTCTAQLCEYRDNFEEFRDLGVQIVGISGDSVAKHADFSKQNQFPFPLLSDPTHQVVKAYKCTSKWTFGFANRAICVVNQKGEIVWRHVEAVAVTRRRAEELKASLRSLEQQGLL
jgi:peroxiredoxin Q/BCP